MFLCQPYCIAVLRRWQFAHLISHFSISFIMFFKEPYVTRLDTSILLSFVWSNSRTTGSFSPQSIHGWFIR